MSAEGRTSRAVVVGTGFIGPVHLEGLRRAGVQVGGIVGSSPEKSHVAASRLDLPRGYDSLDDVLADPEIDAVHLATPNRLHFAQAAATLRAGKHVLCEKPLAMTSVQTAELVRIAAASGRVAGVAYNVRFYPLCHEAAARTFSGSGVSHRETAPIAILAATTRASQTRLSGSFASSTDTSKQATSLPRSRFRRSPTAIAKCSYVRPFYGAPAKSVGWRSEHERLVCGHRSRWRDDRCRGCDARRLPAS